MRQYLWLLVLVIVLGALGGFWNRAPRVAAPPPQAQANTPSPESRLLPFDATKVTALEYYRGRNPFIVVKRERSQGWSLEYPFRAPADTYLVERSLTALTFTTMASTVPAPGAKPLDFGLGEDHASMKVVLRTEGGDLWLELGSASPNGAMRYARTSLRDDIVLIDKRHVQGLPKHPNEVLNRKIFPLADEPLSSIGIKEGTRLVVLQAGEKRWSIVSPLRAPTDIQAMTEWLKRVAAITADSVHPGEESRRAPVGRLTGSLQMTAGRTTVTTELYRTDEGVIALRSDQPHLRFVLSAAMLSLIFPDPFTLRDKHLLDAQSDSVAAVDLSQDGGALHFTRTIAGWAANGRRLPDGPAAAMERWMKELQVVQGAALVAGLEHCGVKGPARWGVTLRGYDGQVLGQLTFARTMACGDVATLPSGEWIRLPNSSLIDYMPSSRV